MRDEYTGKEVEDTVVDTSEMHEINRRLQSVVDEAPSDAVVALEVIKGRGGYRAILKVFSSQARFIGGSRAKNFAGAIDEIFDEVRTQLHDWKSRRVLDYQT